MAEDDGDSFGTMPLAEVEDVLDFILWSNPATMLPTPELVTIWLGDLRRRPDADAPEIQRAIANALDYLTDDTPAPADGERAIRGN